MLSGFKKLFTDTDPLWKIPEKGNLVDLDRRTMTEKGIAEIDTSKDTLVRYMVLV
jgi:hypothetical protein